MPRRQKDRPQPFYDVVYLHRMRAMVRRVAIALAIIFVGVQGQAQEAASRTDPFVRLRFLIGTWRGDQSGDPGRGTVERTYLHVLNGRFIQETNTSTYPPQEKNKTGEVHHHMSIISYDSGRSRFVLRQFHTEGFVNTYVEEPADDPRTIVFVSEAIENIPSGWRARETYTIVNEDEFKERFDLARPGADFKVYSEARLKRIR
jgi:hypothetical protein